MHMRITTRAVYYYCIYYYFDVIYNSQFAIIRCSHLIIPVLWYKKTSESIILEPSIHMFIGQFTRLRYAKGAVIECNAKFRVQLHATLEYLSVVSGSTSYLSSCNF